MSCLLGNNSLDVLPCLTSFFTQAVISRGQRVEGSFINKSLLTLGTVINKLAAGQASHIPFRDSKLTRMLQVGRTAEEKLNLT